MEESYQTDTPLLFCNHLPEPFQLFYSTLRRLPQK